MNLGEELMEQDEDERAAVRDLLTAVRSYAERPTRSHHNQLDLAIQDYQAARGKAAWRAVRRVEPPNTQGEW